MESTDTRTLRLEIPPCTLVKAAPDPIWTTLPANTIAINGWRILFATDLAVFWEGTIDLSGYVRDMKTFYPTVGMTQEGSFVAEAGGSGSVTYTIVSAIPLIPEDVFTQVLLMNGGPGFLNNPGLTGGLTLGQNQQNWNTVVFAQSELHVPNANIVPNPFGISQRIEVNQSGSLSPTAADTLYVMKMVFPLGLNQTTLQIPASRVILPGKFGIEPDVEYMMRLKRSTELANQV
jgi:hypothetical protein